jgi:hypothetical protein
MKIRLKIFKFPSTFISQFSFIIHPHHELCMCIIIQLANFSIEVHIYYFAWTKPIHLYIQSEDLPWVSIYRACQPSRFWHALSLFRTFTISHKTLF